MILLRKMILVLSSMPDNQLTELWETIILGVDDLFVGLPDFVGLAGAYLI
jgi:hypothetical protein